MKKKRVVKRKRLRGDDAADAKATRAAEKLVPLDEKAERRKRRKERKERKASRAVKVAQTTSKYANAFTPDRMEWRNIKGEPPKVDDQGRLLERTQFAYHGADGVLLKLEGWAVGVKLPTPPGVIEEIGRARERLIYARSKHQKADPKDIDLVNSGSNSHTWGGVGHQGPPDGAEVIMGQAGQPEDSGGARFKGVGGGVPYPDPLTTGKRKPRVPRGKRSDEGLTAEQLAKREKRRSRREARKQRRMGLA